MARLGDRRVNRNLPFDRFAMEQIAGHAAGRTMDQKIARFQPQHRGNTEDGIVPAACPGNLFHREPSKADSVKRVDHPVAPSPHHALAVKLVAVVSA